MAARPKRDRYEGDTLTEQIIELRDSGLIDPHDVADRIWWRHGRAFTAPELMTEEEVRAIITERVRRTFNQTNRMIRRLPPLGWGDNTEGGNQSPNDQSPPPKSSASMSRIARSWLDQTLAVPDADRDHPRYVLWGDATVADWTVVADAYGRLAAANDRERARCEAYAAALVDAGADCLRDLPPDEQERLREMTEAD